MSDDILDLIKGGPGNHRIVARRASRVFDGTDRFVVKSVKPPAWGATQSAAPPAGFHPIPGGKHSGFTNGKSGRARRYWYPHDADVGAASKHHREQANQIDQAHLYSRTASGYPKDKAAKKELENHRHAHYALKDGDYRVGAAPKKKAPAKKRQSASKVHKVNATSSSRYRERGQTVTEYSIDDPTSPGGERFHTYTGRGKTAAERKKHALEQHAKKHGIDSPIKHSADPTGERKAAEKKRGVGSAKDRKKAPTGGKHRIAVGRGKHEEVDTHHAHGLYALHETTSDNEKKMAQLRGRKVKREFGVTHVPSGMGLGHGSERAMKKLSRHMHEHAGDAGHDAKFGKQPGPDAYERMTAAYRDHK